MTALERRRTKTEQDKIKAALEAILFACAEPLDTEKTAKLMLCDEPTLLNCLDLIKREYDSESHGIELLNLGGKYQFATKKEHAEIIRSVLSIKKNAPLSSAAFEVLAVIAYNQPVTRAFVEQVRGVDCSAVISTLCQRNLIEERGRLDLPGRPLVYCTTENFLRCFELSSLDELPQLPAKPEKPEDGDGEMDGQISIM